jgi:hypothetical protein
MRVDGGGEVDEEIDEEEDVDGDPGGVYVSAMHRKAQSAKY